MTASAHQAVECPIEQALIKALLYFEIFSYPLTAEEVFHFARYRETSVQEVSEKLQGMVEKGLVYRFGRFYQTRDEPQWEARRLDCNQRADHFLPIARRMARLIGAFPFIRAVFVSGSLSKHCMRPNSDIDFFLITEPGRLWLARTMLVLFKKIFLLNSHKYFCVNYFVDTEHLEIEDKNLFTATETVTLLPLYGRDWYEGFYKANSWAWELYPNVPQRPAPGIAPHKKGLLKNVLEKLLPGKFGNWLDQKAMQSTVAFWKKKFRHFDREKFDLALRSRRHISKHHPLHFQEKVLNTLARRLREFPV
ncbi:MAG: hypothetical protein R2791_21815 [Saprospiraceae bacterium]